MKKFRTRAIALGASAGVLLIANIAAAAWLSYGEGTGAASALSQVDEVELTVSSVTDAYPGWSDTIVVTVPNGNDYAIGVTQLDVTVTNADCEISNLEIDDEGAGGEANVLGDLVAGVEGSIIPAESEYTYELPVSMVADADDDCQGSTFTIEVDATLSSAAHLSEAAE